MPPASEVERMVLAMPQVKERCDQIALEVETEAQELAYARAYEHGDYRAGIHRVRVDGPGSRVLAEDEKSKWLEVGTGIYGKHRTPIVPTTAKVLAWKKDGEWHFAKSVRGRPGSHVLRDASRTVAERHSLRWVDNLGDG